MITGHFMIVPKNEKGIQDYENDVGKNSENLFFYDIPEDEFDFLWKHRVFEILNRKFNLLIDEYEQETVTADQLKEAYKEISIRKGVWLDAINKTIELGTLAYLNF